MPSLRHRSAFCAWVVAGVLLFLGTFGELFHATFHTAGLSRQEAAARWHHAHPGQDPPQALAAADGACGLCEWAATSGVPMVGAPPVALVFASLSIPGPILSAPASARRLPRRRTARGPPQSA
jgi:hypothetical protein